MQEDKKRAKEKQKKDVKPWIKINNLLSIEEKIKKDMAIEDQGLEVLAKFAGKPKKDQECR